MSHDLDGVLSQTDVLALLRVQSERMQRQFFPSPREYAPLGDHGVPARIAGTEQSA